MIGLLVLYGCGAVDPPAPKVPPEAPPAPAAPPPSRADAANRKLPSDAGGLRFEERAIVDPTEHLDARAVVPVGWAPKSDGFPGWFVPPEGAGLGWMTSYKVGSSCAGACVPKDWKKVVDAQMLDHVPEAQLQHDESLPDGGRIRWGGDATSARVYAAWFHEGASNYQECSVNLDSAAMVRLTDAFVEACRATAFGG